MKLKITITMDNAAFDPDFGFEVARILESLATDIKAHNCLTGPDDHETLTDINGNRVGEAKVTK